MYKKTNEQIENGEVLIISDMDKEGNAFVTIQGGGAGIMTNVAQLVHQVSKMLGLTLKETFEYIEEGISEQLIEELYDEFKKGMF
jgi:hypothetical protein